MDETFAKLGYPELRDPTPEDDDIPLEERTLESLMASGLDEHRARFVLAIENGEIDLNEPGREI